MQAIITAITEAMTAEEMSVSRLSVASGVPRMTLARRMEHPETFTLSELAAVARALGLKPEVAITPATHREAS